MSAYTNTFDKVREFPDMSAQYYGTPYPEPNDLIDVMLETLPYAQLVPPREANALAVTLATKLGNTKLAETFSKHYTPQNPFAFPAAKQLPWAPPCDPGICAKGVCLPCERGCVPDWCQRVLFWTCADIYTDGRSRTAYFVTKE